VIEMGAEDEARARATLAAMQERLARGPHDALGIGSGAEPEQIRSAFLELTKQYHPQKFGRMSTELQRLSNEIFLGLKSAHDQLVKALGPSPRVDRSSQMPPFRVAGSGPNQAIGTQPQQVVTAAQAQAVRNQPAAAQPAQRPTPTSTATARPPSPQQGTRPAPGRSATPPVGVPVQPASTATRPTQPMATVPRAPAAAARPVTPQQQPTARPATAPAFDERAELTAVMELIRRSDWNGAAQKLSVIAQKLPESKRYRALLAYARSKIAAGANRIDDAIQELQRALQIDPDLAQAKTALQELQSRRK
jgi:hypothetical protein